MVKQISVMYLYWYGVFTILIYTLLMRVIAILPSIIPLKHNNCNVVRISTWTLQCYIDQISLKIISVMVQKFLKRYTVYQLLAQEQECMRKEINDPFKLCCLSGVSSAVLWCQWPRWLRSWQSYRGPLTPWVIAAVAVVLWLYENVKCSLGFFRSHIKTEKLRSMTAKCCASFCCNLIS